MATQVSLNSGAVASAGALALQTNGTTEAFSISTGQVATLAQNPILTSGTANGVAYLNGSKAVTSGSALTFDGTNFSTTGTASATKMIPTGGSATGNGMYLPASNTLAWSNNGSETMRLDSAGNLGLGVTPSAWGLGKAMEIGWSGNGLWGVQSSGDMRITANTYFDGTNYKLVSGGSYASYYRQSNGIHSWLTSTGTTAGNATFTSAMTLDASGNLGVGTTSPDTKLNTEGGSLRVSGTRTAGSFLDVAPSNTGTDGVAFSVSYYGSGNYGPLKFTTGGSERARIDSSGYLLVGKTSASNTVTGSMFVDPSTSTHYLSIVNTTGDNSGARLLYLNRQGSDGDLIQFNQANTQEGSISVSGTTVSYNGGHLSRWAQTTAPKDNTLVKGTVLSNLDEMNVYTDEEGNPVDNEQLNKVKVSDVEGDVNVAGVFVNWSHDEAHDVDEINMAMTGDMIIRIAQGVTIARGDLLMSAGDGTAKPQGDDIVRSKTVAKVTSIHVTCTYEDGSYCVPCVLMAC